MVQTSKKRFILLFGQLQLTPQTIFMKTRVLDSQGGRKLRHKLVKGHHVFSLLFKALLVFCQIPSHCGDISPRFALVHVDPVKMSEHGEKFALGLHFLLFNLTVEQIHSGLAYFMKLLEVGPIHFLFLEINNFVGFMHVEVCTLAKEQFVAYFEAVA